MMTYQKILVIDDEINLRNTLALILQHSGYQVTTAGDGKEAMQLIKTDTFDLAFLDLMLPDIDGLSLLPEIRKELPLMPILILTAHATLDSAMTAVRQGARDYIVKPIDPQYILTRLGEVLTEQQQPRRQQEIVAQVQDLLAELHQPNEKSLLAQGMAPALPPTDPKRFLVCGKLTVDLHTRHVSLDNKMIPLAPSTFDYLIVLIKHSPKPVPYDILVKEAQNYNVTRAEAREISRWQVHELRKALETDLRHPSYIITVRDIGYCLVT